MLYDYYTYTDTTQWATHAIHHYKINNNNIAFFKSTERFPKMISDLKNTSVSLPHFSVMNIVHVPGRGEGRETPLFGLYGDMPLDWVWFFGLAVLDRVYNLTCLCPKQGMVLRAERLEPRLLAVSVFS